MERTHQESKEEELIETNSSTTAATSTENNYDKDEYYKSKGLSAYDDLEKKFQEFQNAFRRMNEAFGQKLLEQFGIANPDIKYTHEPQVITAKDAAKHMIGKKNILILTGAGLSAASGIPTFRGDNGFWTRTYGDETDPQVILTQRFFTQNPELNWQWHYDFIELEDRCKPNKGHHAILKFQEYCHLQNDIESFLVTQNIDNYHPQLIQQSKILMKNQEEKKQGESNYAFTPFVYEIHGNVKYMHCFNDEEDCGQQFYKAPTLDQVKDKTNHVPKCSSCGKNMKPHCMFFDESYSETYYRSESVHKFMEEKMDCLIVVGTALATGLAKRIVNKALGKIECPVIEINLETSIDRGYNLQILEKSEIALDQLFNEYYRLRSPKVDILQSGQVKSQARASSVVNQSKNPIQKQIIVQNNTKQMTQAKQTNLKQASTSTGKAVQQKPAVSKAVTSSNKQKIIPKR
ncbi:silent information regulator protein sir2 [Stylonychia lemnae]|uniref:Silent information regulator protein sir2 n=1 Tax=Stylonychia lemnae TaxID=5949 RepID=A0A078A1W3_STYLE|nr:silent information regulator protein sir2 [Stylonychia lemnae]|eukprot:CDW75458.1 silent information regulator protein sir2 [Stylonychia lemnae]